MKEYMERQAKRLQVQQDRIAWQETQSRYLVDQQRVGESYSGGEAEEEECTCSSQRSDQRLLIRR
jgi:hypothetical protein